MTKIRLKVRDCVKTVAEPWHSRPDSALILPRSSIRANQTSAVAPRQEGQPLEQLHILFVLQKRAMQLGQRVLCIPFQIFG